MKTEETNQIGALTKEVAALGATMTNEFGHISDRLDSHSQQIKGLAADMGEVKQSIAIRQAMNGYREEHEREEAAHAALMEDRQTDDVLQKRGKFYDALLLVAGAVVGGSTGMFFDWLRGFVSCKPNP